MSSVPTTPTPDTPPETVEQRFRRLEATWLDEIGYSSSPTELRAHPAFQEIISLGEEVIPLVLADLEKAPRHWVWALPRITEVNPVPPSDGGNIRKMAEAWLRWGREKGYRW